MLPPFVRVAMFAAVRILHGCHCAVAWGSLYPAAHTALALYAPALAGAQAHEALLAICTALIVMELRGALRSFWHFAGVVLQLILCIALWAEVSPQMGILMHAWAPLLLLERFVVLVLAGVTILVVKDVIALVFGFEPESSC